MTYLIEKDVLIAKLKKRIRDYWSDSENTMGIYPYALEEVIKYIDTLEVKEVDLEKEINKHWGEWAKEDGFHSIDFAKHFFELGMQVSNKAQKGEKV